MNRINSTTTFLFVNNALVIVALIAAVFDQPAIYTTFFAISVALQISQLRKMSSKT